MTVVLQIGQVVSLCNHLSRQSAWKQCLHVQISFSFSNALYSSKHMGQESLLGPEMHCLPPIITSSVENPSLDSCVAMLATDNSSLVLGDDGRGRSEGGGNVNLGISNTLVLLLWDVWMFASSISINFLTHRRQYPMQNNVPSVAIASMTKHIMMILRTDLLVDLPVEIVFYCWVHIYI